MATEGPLSGSSLAQGRVAGAGSSGQGATTRSGGAISSRGRAMAE